MEKEPVVIAAIFTMIYFFTFNHFVNGFIHDEFRALQVVQGIQEYGVPAYLDRNYYQHPPLLYLAILLPSTFIPIDLAAMLIELACAFGTLYFFYRLANDFVGRKPALLGTVILGTHPNLWLWSNRFLHEAPLLLFFTASAYFFAVAMRTKKRSDWLILGVVLGLGFNLKISTMLVGPIILLHMFMEGRLINLSKKLKFDIKGFNMVILAGIIGVLIYLPYFAYTLINNAPSQTQIFGREIAGAAAFSLPEPWYFYVTEFPNFVNIAVLPFFIYGVLAAVVKENKKLINYLVWFIVPVIFFMIPSYKVYRYINPVFPVLILFVAYGLTVPPQTIMQLLGRRGSSDMKRKLSCMKRNLKKIEASYDFIWSLREKFVSWDIVGAHLSSARKTGISAAKFIKSIRSSDEVFITDTIPELEISMDKEISEIIAELESKIEKGGTKKKVDAKKFWIAQVAICILIASFGAYQSLSTVLFDGDWPSGYQAWNTINSLDSNGVLLTQEYWWAAEFFTDPFVEYLTGGMEHDYDSILSFNAEYIIADPSWYYLQNNSVFEPIEFLPELNGTLFSVNWIEFAKVSNYVPFELVTGSEAVWIAVNDIFIGRTPEDGTYKGFLPDNITAEINFRGICYSPKDISVMIHDGIFYECLDTWLECTPTDRISVNLTRRNCFYHPEFVFDRF
jgi:hypothetical protein